MIRVLRNPYLVRDTTCASCLTRLSGLPCTEVFSLRGILRFTLCDSCTIELGGRLLATDKAMTIVSPDPARAGERP
jgi:hypothetical protein